MAENMIQHIAQEQEKKIALHEQAMRLHMQIQNSASLAAEAIVDFASGLKQMRDSRLYEQLGFESFADYTERAVGIKQSMAYNWIRVLENLTPSMIEKNAVIGITKLQLLTQVPPQEREDFAENHDLEEMTVAQLKEELKKYKDQSEQLSLLQEELESEKERAAGESEIQKTEELRREIEEEYRLKLETARAELAQAKNEAENLRKESKKETEREIQKRIEEAKTTIEYEARKTASAEAEERIKAAKTQAVREIKTSLEKIEREKTEAMERAAVLEKQLKISTDTTMVEFSFHFEAAQQHLNKLVDLIKKSENENNTKLAAAIRALLNKTAEVLGNEN